MVLSSDDDEWCLLPEIVQEYSIDIRKYIFKVPLYYINYFNPAI
jgi:hypothetical protein